MPEFFESKVEEIERRIFSLEEKIDMLEDLINVENLGLIELKRMMDEIKTQAVSPFSLEVEEKIKELEKRILTSPVASDERIELLIKEINGLREEVENLKRVKGEIKVSEDYRLKIESLEKIIAELSQKFEQLRPILEKSENLESLKRDFEEKVKKLVEIEEGLRRIGTKPMDQNVLLKLSELKAETEKSVKELDEKVSMIQRRIESLSIPQPTGLEDFKKEVVKKVAEIHERIDGMEEEYKGIIKGLVKKVEERRPKEMEKIVLDLAELSKEVSSLREKISGLESMKGPSLEVLPSINSKLDELMNRTISLEKRLNRIEENLKESASVRPIVIE